MPVSRSNPIPAFPRVISPSPTPSQLEDTSEEYFGPVTRSARKKKAAAEAPPVALQEDIDEEDEDEDSNAEFRRARSKSRSPMRGNLRKISGLTAAKPAAVSSKPLPVPSTPNGKSSNGHLSPASAAPAGWSWRDLSRSPSPLGLIPIHRQWRSFVHRHEVPRKILHVSIGFFTIWLYVSGVQTSAITPKLMAALIPIATVDYLRHNYASLNRFYVRVMGALMRESEYEGWNGVIWYLLGAWIVLGFFPKDVGVMGVLLLSWCDTAASTVGRAYGRYTPRIRRGKSLAGSLAAMAVGVLTAWAYWGWLAPRTGPFVDDVKYPFMFHGTLSLPRALRDVVGLSREQATVGGGLALGIMSLWTGFVASASEVVDLFGWDDNLTIPVLSGMGMWGFLKVFG
ncbi:phosphatidate cytidylyltransferase [Phlyctema vagabunda]|uniref:Phosphatidate cytidylyltransferase n=1 Tax=Phlyctema vagabunda TaxID=108571 RepID=A0ABR4PXT9_9HELO